MEDGEIYHRKGLIRTAYSQDTARLEEFNALESDWKELFRGIMTVASDTCYYDAERGVSRKLGEIWKNHVLTVLIEIVQKDFEEYRETFVQGRGTITQKECIDDLKIKIADWCERLESFMRKEQATSGQHENLALQTAQSMLDLLKKSTDEEISTHGYHRYGWSVNNLNYFRKLQALNTIKRRSDGYLGMIADSGKMDASLSLLLSFIKNYCSITARFNATLSALPDFYHTQILKSKGKATVQDHTFVVINTTGESLILPEGTQFPAGVDAEGQELFYRNGVTEYLTGGRLLKARLLSLKSDKTDADKLCMYDIIVDGESVENKQAEEKLGLELRCGWIIESRMFLLEEGTRKIKISFLGKNFTTFSDLFLLKGEFIVEASHIEGWITRTPEISFTKIDGYDAVCFAFTLEETENPLSPCLEEIHHRITDYPCVRILVGHQNYPYSWTNKIKFNRVHIDLEVKGIQHFRLYNELGELDATQPFFPFGPQGERESWFMFSHEETDKKPLSEVCLEGLWNKLPQTSGGYSDIYKDYLPGHPINNESFQISIVCRKNGSWLADKELFFPLFHTTDGKPDKNLTVRYPFDSKEAGNEWTARKSRNVERFFRITLVAPSIGFGMETYRKLFADILIYNSHHKKKGQKEVPLFPVIPMLSDVSLSYKAFLHNNEGIRLSRLTVFSEEEDCTLSDNHPLFFVEDLDGKERQALYMEFAKMGEERNIRMYLDFAFAEKTFTREFSGLEWYYRKNGFWNKLTSEYIVVENTYGFTQNGYIEIKLPEELFRCPIIRFRVQMLRKEMQLPDIRHIYLNYVNVTAEKGDGSPLPAGTIQGVQPEHEKIKSIFQPFSGIGGKPEETPEESSTRQSARISHRNRALTPKDYEQMVLEHFREIEKVHCLSRMEIAEGEKRVDRRIKVVVFSHTEGNPFPFTPSWKLSEIQKWIELHISPFVEVEVCNPSYLFVEMECHVILKEKAKGREGEMRQWLAECARQYFAPWIQTGDLPELGCQYSLKGLHAWLANESSLERITKLTIRINSSETEAPGISEEDRYVPQQRGERWNVLIPGKMDIQFSPPLKGIDFEIIGSSFKIE